MLLLEEKKLHTCLGRSLFLLILELLVCGCEGTRARGRGGDDDRMQPCNSRLFTLAQGDL